MLSSQFSNIRSTGFDQSSPVQPISDLSQKKSPFFSSKIKNVEKKKKEKNAILLVFQYQEYGIRPELSSPARFRIQGGYPERDGGRRRRRTKEILVSNIGSVCALSFPRTYSNSRELCLKFMTYGVCGVLQTFTPYILYNSSIQAGNEFQPFGLM